MPRGWQEPEKKDKKKKYEIMSGRKNDFFHSLSSTKR
jgi:hypothetical protein